MALACPVLGSRHAEQPLHWGARVSHSLREAHTRDAPAPSRVKFPPGKHGPCEGRRGKQLRATRGCSPDDGDTPLQFQSAAGLKEPSYSAAAASAAEGSSTTQRERAPEGPWAPGTPGPGASAPARGQNGRSPEKWVEERGVRAQIQGSFYRAESAVSRDLGALAAYLYRRGELPHQQRVAAREREREARREKRKGRDRERDGDRGSPSEPPQSLTRAAFGSQEETEKSTLDATQYSTHAGTEAAVADGTASQGLRVLDVMSGSGIRGVRYLEHAGADFVWCNDAAVDCHSALLHNLSAASSHTPSSFPPSPSDSLSPSSPPPFSQSPVTWWMPGDQIVTAQAQAVSDQSQPSSAQSQPSSAQSQAATAQSQASSAQLREEGEEAVVEGEGAVLRGDAKWRKAREGKSGLEGAKWRITHEDALRVLYLCYQRKDFFDVIDVDSFGGNTSCLGPALGATVHRGGLLYATSTDGFSTGGHAPLRSLASFGAYVRGPIPWCNELGMRMLIGAAVREAATRGLQVRPLFSLYSFHGPVFRCMLQVSNSAYAAASAPPEDATATPTPPEGRQQLAESYGFLGFCHSCGESRVLRWDSLGAGCLCDSPRCNPPAVSQSSSADSPSSEPLAQASPPRAGGERAGEGATGGLWEGTPKGTSTNVDLSWHTEGAPLPQETGPGTGTVPDTGTGARAPEAYAGGESSRRQGSAVPRGKPMLVVGPVWTGPLHCQQTVEALAGEAERRGWGAAERTLRLMQGEADPSLPPWFIRVDEVAKGAKAKTPPLPKFLQLLHENGYRAVRSHVDLRAIKTNCPFHKCVALLQTISQ